MRHLISRDFDPTGITNYHDKLLLEKQQTYFWTILQHTLRNPLGKSSILSFKSDSDEAISDAIRCYFHHQRLQTQSVAKPIVVSAHMRNLENLSLDKHKGLQVKFITGWFQALDTLNDARGTTTGYELVYSWVVWALALDPDLTQNFTSIDVLPSNDDPAATCNKLKYNLTQEAILLDNMQQDKHCANFHQLGYLNYNILDNAPEDYLVHQSKSSKTAIMDYLAYKSS